MDIPVLTNLVKGLRLFLDSKRLKWLTIVFIISAIVTLIVQRAAPFLGALTVIPVIISLAFPTYFLLAAIFSLGGLQRFVASEESFKQSVVYFIPWIIVSAILAVILFFGAFAVFFVIFIIGGFLGWIIFQAFLSSRSSLRYAESVQVATRGKFATALFSIANVFNYVILIGAFFGTWLLINPGILVTSAGTFVGALFGLLLALGFNFLNGMIILWERNKRSVDNIVLLGIFISFYSAYFIYNVLSGATFELSVVDLSVTIFFLLYTMSNVGLTLTSRAEMETRFKLSKELGATLTFFLASSYMAVLALFIVIGTINPLWDVQFAGSLGDIIKLLLFPLVALIMELIYVRRWRKEPEEVVEPETPAEEVPELVETIPAEEETIEEEPVVLEEEPEIEDEVPSEPEEIEPELDEEPGETSDDASDTEPDYDEE